VLNMCDLFEDAKMILAPSVLYVSPNFQHPGSTPNIQCHADPDQAHRHKS